MTSAPFDRYIITQTISPFNIYEDMFVPIHHYTPAFIRYDSESFLEYDWMGQGVKGALCVQAAEVKGGPRGYTVSCYIMGKRCSHHGTSVGYKTKLVFTKNMAFTLFKNVIF